MKDIIKCFEAKDLILVDGVKYEFDSIISYYSRQGRCPLKELKRVSYMKENWPLAGHTNHWIGKCEEDISSSISIRAVVKIGEIVKFEGRFFKLESCPTDNIELADLGDINVEGEYV